MTKWCREPDSEGPGVTRDAAELLRRAKTLSDIQHQKQLRPRQQNVTPLSKKTPNTLAQNRPAKRPASKLVSKSTAWRFLALTAKSVLRTARPTFAPTPTR